MFQLSWHLKAKKPEKIAPRDRPPVPVLGQSFLLWEEHCVECAPPDCYNSCKLFNTRKDQKCARFTHGIVPNTQISGAYDFGAEITFRRWAKLETQWPKTPIYRTTGQSKRLSKFFNRIEYLASFLSDLSHKIDSKRKINGAAIHYIHELYRRLEKGEEQENRYDGVFLELFLIQLESASFTFEVVDKHGACVREKLSLSKGWNRFFFERSRFASQKSNIALARLTNNSMQEIPVVITWLHWIKIAPTFKAYSELHNANDTARTQDDVKSIKCCVFDLDNTLWDGVIGDDGVDGVTLRPETLDFIRALDERGIICAVASKNEYGIAWEKIQREKLDELLLFPQINWLPKSENIRKISEAMNVALDTFAFIDDNPFERAEVRSHLPQVRVFDDKNLNLLLDNIGFQVPITEASSKRRLSYLTESKRRTIQASLGSTSDEFLINCEMHLQFYPAIDHFERCHELLERTNQFNLSGNRQNEAEFSIQLSHGMNICWSVRDKFGDYGIVGFLHVDDTKQSAWEVTEFVMSCRVAEKRVEESVFQALLNFGKSKNTPINLRIKYTERNIPLQKKLLTLGMTALEENNEQCLMQFPNTFEKSNIVKRQNEWIG